MTTANKITILRILVVPFFATQALYYVGTGDERFRLSAILAFWIAAILDGVDGYIARRYNQRSELGAILDPLADKMLLVTGLIVLTLNNEPHLYSIPLWCTAIILGRDVILIGDRGDSRIRHHDRIGRVRRGGQRVGRTRHGRRIGSNITAVVSVSHDNCADHDENRCRNSDSNTGPSPRF